MTIARNEFLKYPVRIVLSSTDIKNRLSANSKTLGAFDLLRRNERWMGEVTALFTAEILTGNYDDGLISNVYKLINLTADLGTVESTYFRNLWSTISHMAYIDLNNDIGNNWLDLKDSNLLSILLDKLINLIYNKKYIGKTPMDFLDSQVLNKHLEAVASWLLNYNTECREYIKYDIRQLFKLEQSLTVDDARMPIVINELAIRGYRKITVNDYRHLADNYMKSNIVEDLTPA